MSTKTFSPLMLAQQFPHFTRTIIYLQTFSSGAVTFGKSPPRDGGSLGALSASF